MARAAPNSIMKVWVNLPLAIKGVVVIAVPLAILLVSMVSLFFASMAEAQAEDDVRATFAIQNDIHEIHALLAEAAGGMRGYLLTGKETFLQPYFKAEANMPQTIERLRGSIRDAEISSRLKRVEELVAQKREGLASMRRFGTGTGKDTLLPELLAAMESNKAVLDQLRTEIDLMQQREQVLLEGRRETADAARSRNLALTAISGAIGLLGSLGAVSLFSSGIVRRIQMLEDNAQRLERGEPLLETDLETDEVGRLARQLQHASELLRAREQALREGEERFRMVVEGVRDYGIFALDIDGRVVSWNVGAERIKGWTSEEIVGRHFSCFYPDDTRAETPGRMLAAARANERAEDEGWRVRKDGSRFWANVVITALRDDRGLLKGYSKVTRDITERRRVEQDLLLAREEAEAASLAKSEFLSRMSHELRTPLNAILGFAQLIELDEADLSEANKRSIGQILRAGRHLLGLIDEVLDIAGIEAGRMQLAMESCVAGDLIREAVDLSQPIGLARGIRILAPDASMSSPTVWCDRRRGVQILLNLLSNAIKYNRPEGVVVLSLELHPGRVRISVCDDGPGIGEKDVGRLFMPFVRIQSSSGGAAVEGTGLGLALSKRLVEMMGGQIGFRNRASGGAEFYFDLLSAPAIGADRDLSDLQSGPGPIASSMQGSILYIEDNLSNVQLIESLLARRFPDVRLLTAMQGTIGLELARRHGPDLILVDLHLPDMDGEVLIRTLRADDAGRACIIAVTADAVGDVEARVRRAGASDFMTKPIDVKALIDRVAARLASQRTGASA